MKGQLDNSKPIYLQIKEIIEDSIINDQIKAGERVPSTNELASASLRLSELARARAARRLRATQRCWRAFCQSPLSKA